MSVEDINSGTIERINEIDVQTTAALADVQSIMPELEALASRIAPYFTVGQITHNETQFDVSGISTPTFTELGDSDTSLSAISDDEIETLSAGSGALHGVMKSRLDSVEEALSILWADLQAVFGGERPAVAFKEDDYVASLIESVEAQVESNLDDPDQQTAHEGRYYDNDSARRNSARASELSNSSYEFSGRGFPMASETLADLRAFIATKHGMDESTRERTVILQQNTLSMENKRKAIDAGLRYDQILIAHFEQKQQRAFQVAVATLRAVQDFADLKAAVTGEQLGLQNDYVGMTAENQRVVAAEIGQNVRAYEEKVNAMVAKAGGYMDAHGEEAQAYILRKRALGTEKEFALSEKYLDIDVLKTNLVNTLKAWAVNMAAFEEMVGVRINAASAAATTQLGIAAAARNRITTVVGLLSGSTDSTTGA